MINKMKKFKFLGLIGIDILIIVLLFKVSPVLSIIVSGLLGFVIGLVVAGATVAYGSKKLYDHRKAPELEEQEHNM